MISILSNFLPDYFRKELEELQDKIPPRPLSEIYERIYKELGKDYLLHRRADKIVKNHIKRLRDLGYEVELKKAA